MTFASILNAEENEQVRQLLVSVGAPWAFIGGIRRLNSIAGGKTSSDWQWVNGDIWSYTKFRSGEPNNTVEPNIHFVTSDNAWNDTSDYTGAAVYKLNKSAIGYYGLVKDAYPRLNPYSSGVKAVQTWTPRTASNETNYWLSVCWSPELRLFVAVAYLGSNKVMTSPNGINWTGRASSNEANQWIGVCWSPERMLFVAVSENGTNRVMTSPDGITWTPRTSSNEGSQWFSVCWSKELGIFVVVAYGGGNRVMTSPDGITWSSTNVTGVPASSWFSVCWSKELGIFVAVAVGGPNKVMTSPNGINWTGRASSNEDNQWYNVCWSGELGIFVAVAQYGTNRVMTSPNGINWTGQRSSNEAYEWFSVCWSKELGLFAAFSRDGTNIIMTSHNGITWTGRQSTNDSNTWWHGSCWSPELGIFVAVAQKGSKRVMTSSLKGRPPTSYNVFDNTYTISSNTGNGSGGIITTNGSYTIHSFTTVGTTTFTVTSPISIDYFVVAGGGSGGSGRGGGGGAGGVLSGSIILQTGSYTINVGAGGASASNDNQGNDGGSSSIGTLIVATGGGGGGGWNTRRGRNGGSGGGVCAPTSDSPGTGINGQGFSGASQASDNAGGGGGGAGGSGSGSTGGIGISTTIRGSLEYYAGGGGAGGYGNEYGLAYGTYGGGNGSNGQTSPQDGIPNTGGGGGGQISFTSGAGGSGIVIIRYIPPTNSIDETGKWNFQNMDVTTLTVNNVSVNSDDRLKHNEIVITNGLNVIDRLTPKFYQKTQVLLDASYNGDLSGHAWTYEAGLIAQEVLQISDLSYVVGGGDYYEQKYIYNRQTNDLSYNNYEISANNYDQSANYYEISTNNYEISANNYEVSYNLIAQAYNLNYNSVFVYGLAAIKELHAKVKAKEISILNRQAIINNLITRIEALESARQDVSNNIL